ncbi:MAG TPA: DnaJ domain-containing protein [Terriglobia bacterium]|jgi:hypothetical protein
MESRKPSLKDYYGVLGVAPESTTSQIKKAYRALAHRFHPDRLQSESDVHTGAEKMIEINEAFEILSDVKRRATYDRDLAAEKAPPRPPVPAEQPLQDWELPTPSPRQTPAKAKSASNVSMDQSVAREFLDKLKAQLLAEAMDVKMHERLDKNWRWILQGKTWGANYWVGMRQISLLNPNSTREVITQMQTWVEKQRSILKNNFFIIIFAFQSLHEGETVLKLLRTFCNREENSSAKNLVNIVAMDVNLRRSVLCGKRAGDAKYAAILKALSVG